MVIENAHVTEADDEITFGPEDDQNYDPTPWCIACGAKTQSKCHCGQIADNE